MALCDFTVLMQREEGFRRLVVPQWCDPCNSTHKLCSLYSADILTLVSPDVRSRCIDNLVFSCNTHSAVCTKAELGLEYSVSFDTGTSFCERQNSKDM